MANDSRMVMLLAIIRRGMGAQYLKAIQDDDVVLHFQCVGKGTAPSEVMHILGLGNSEKDIVISFATQKTAQKFRL